jgi:hypothetical protein
MKCFHFSYCSQLPSNAAGSEDVNRSKYIAANAKFEAQYRFNDCSINRFFTQVILQQFSHVISFLHLLNSLFSRRYKKSCYNNENLYYGPLDNDTMQSDTWLQTFRKNRRLSTQFVSRFVINVTSAESAKSFGLHNEAFSVLCVRYIPLNFVCLERRMDKDVGKNYSFYILISINYCTWQLLSISPKTKRICKLYLHALKQWRVAACCCICWIFHLVIPVLSALFQYSFQKCRIIKSEY